MHYRKLKTLTLRKNKNILYITPVVLLFYFFPDNGKLVHCNGWNALFLLIAFKVETVRLLPDFWPLSCLHLLACLDPRTEELSGATYIRSPHIYFYYIHIIISTF